MLSFIMLYFLIVSSLKSRKFKGKTITVSVEINPQHQERILSHTQWEDGANTKSIWRPSQNVTVIIMLYKNI